MVEQAVTVQFDLCGFTLICGKFILGVKYRLARKEVVLLQDTSARSAGTTSNPFQRNYRKDPSELAPTLPVQHALYWA
jgi:hypothetical protein